jgi:predicted PurR-regulated permease PerM
MTDVSGEPPVESSARLSDVLVSVRSALAVLALLALTALMLEIALHSERVIAWVLVAGAIAVLLYPAVEFGSKWMSRSIVVLLLVIAALSTIGFLGYRIVNDVSAATDSLQEAAPKRAAELEKNSDLLRQVHLRRRVQSLVNDLPNRFTGGSATKAIESAATRGVAFVAGTILTIFFTVYGPRIVGAGLDEIRDPKRRRRVERVLVHGTRRGLDLARVKLLEAIVGGVLAYVIARAANVPGPAALGVWAGFWTLLPIAGVLLGALPIVLFAGAASLTRAVVVGVAFAAIGIGEYLLTRFAERKTVEVGSFLIVFAGFGGLELYGLTGALLGVLGVIVLVGILDELGRVDDELLAEEAPARPADESGLLITPRRE